MNFLPLAISLAVGVYCADFIHQFAAVISAVFFIVTISALLLKKKEYIIDIIAIGVAMMVGVSLYFYNSVPRDGTRYIGNYVTARGCICELPYDNNGINRYILYTDEIEFDGKTEKTGFKIIVNAEKRFKCGDSVEVKGKINLIENSYDTDPFNSKNYYASKGIYFKTTALDMDKSAAEYKYNSPVYAANLLKSRLVGLIEQHFSGDVAAAMTAILTGNKNGFSKTYDEVLERSGTRHLFYPAFVHVMLISFIIGMMSSYVPKRMRDYLLVVLLTLYMLFSASPSSMKAASVIIVLVLCKRFFGSGEAINSLSLFVLICGVINPMLFFHAGFVYSVVSSFIIRKFTPILRSRDKISDFLGRQFIFVIGLMPLSIYFFGKASLYSYLASMVFIPVLIFILILSPLFLINCAVSATVPMAWVIHKFVTVILHIPVVINFLPFSTIHLPKPSVVFLIAFYCAMAAVWYAHYKKDKKKFICIMVSLGLFGSQIAYTLRDIDKIHINFINVGQGDATLIQVPISGNILIDGGGGAAYSTYNIGENVFVPYLTEHGATVIQAAFVSHYHKDHAEGIVAAMNQLNVKNVFLPDVRPEDEWRIELENAAKENDTKIWYVSKGVQVELDGVLIDVIPPDEGVMFGEDVNDESLLIKIKYGEFDAVFTGDMTKRGEKYFAKAGFLNDAEVLKVAHHGSQTSTTAEMINAVKPEYALIGLGEDNEYEFPHEPVLERLEGSEIFRTDECGSIILSADKQGKVSVRTEK